MEWDSSDLCRIGSVRRRIARRRVVIIQVPIKKIHMVLNTIPFTNMSVCQTLLYPDYWCPILYISPKLFTYIPMYRKCQIVSPIISRLLMSDCPLLSNIIHQTVDLHSHLPLLLHCDFQWRVIPVPVLNHHHKVPIYLWNVLSNLMKNKFCTNQNF